MQYTNDLFTEYCGKRNVNIWWWSQHEMKYANRNIYTEQYTREWINMNSNEYFVNWTHTLQCIALDGVRLWWFYGCQTHTLNVLPEIYQIKKEKRLNLTYACPWVSIARIFCIQKGKNDNRGSHQSCCKNFVYNFTLRYARIKLHFKWSSKWEKYFAFMLIQLTHGVHCTLCYA